MSLSPHSRPRQGGCFVALILCLGLLCASGTPAARADDSSKATKIAQLLQLTRLAEILRAADGSFDQNDAVRAWGRFYSENMTETELDAILAFYRSPAGQKDVSATLAALPRFQHYMLEKRSAVTSTVGRSAPATHTSSAAPAGPTLAGSTLAAATPNEAATPNSAAGPNAVAPDAVPFGTSTPGASTMRPWDSNPIAPNGRLVPSSAASETCDVAPPAAAGTHTVPPSGRSVVCVCTDDRGALTQDPVIAESSGDSRVDSGALKMARSDSGRYVPPTLDGRPQRACFRFAIDFRRHQ